MLGVFHVSSTALPEFDQVSISTDDNGRRFLSVPVVGYKNDIHGDGKKVILHESSNKLCCPVRTFKTWRTKTRSLRREVRRCPLLFSLQRPIKRLTPAKCLSILKGVAIDADLDPAVFTARTFHKSSIMAGIRAGVDPDAIFRLGGWRSAETFFKHYVVQEIPRAFTDIIFGINDADIHDLNKSTL